MDILVIGSGGREHAIVWKLKQSKAVDKLYCAPGNGGIARIAECVPLSAMDIEGIVRFSKDKAIDLVMVAPDDPLAAGMVDALQHAGVRAFGPSKLAAEIEASKAFSKTLMQKYNIPTAAFECFENSEAAIQYVEQAQMPCVVKADGLALGKGVIICNTAAEAKAAIKSIMEDKKFGTAGSKVVIEEFMTGPEVSVLAFTDGTAIVPMVSSQDHKRAYDNDQGPNTGGMGTFSPSRVYTDDIAKLCMETIFKPSIDAMNKEGRKFKGVIYFGLMLTQDGPKLLEYNARFGDPETQVVLPRLKTDLLDIFNAIIDEKLSEITIEWDDSAAVCVIMASGGYPDAYEKGLEISGIESALSLPDIMVFHAGTKLEGEKTLTHGGRVLGVTALAEDLEKAREKAYEAIQCIHFPQAHYRRDIGYKDL